MFKKYGNAVSVFFDLLGTMPQTPLFVMKNNCFTSGYCQLESRIVKSGAKTGAIIGKIGRQIGCLYHADSNSSGRLQMSASTMRMIGPP